MNTQVPLIKYMRDAGVSQLDLAEKIGVTQGAIQQLLKRVNEKSREAFVVLNQLGQVESIKEVRAVGEQKTTKGHQAA